MKQKKQPRNSKYTQCSVHPKVSSLRFPASFSPAKKRVTEGHRDHRSSRASFFFRVRFHTHRFIIHVYFVWYPPWYNIQRATTARPCGQYIPLWTHHLYSKEVTLDSLSLSLSLEMTNNVYLWTTIAPFCFFFYSLCFALYILRYMYIFKFIGVYLVGCWCFSCVCLFLFVSSCADATQAIFSFSFNPAGSLSKERRITTCGLVLYWHKVNSW